MKRLYSVLICTTFLFPSSKSYANEEQQKQIDTILQILTAQEEVVTKLTTENKKQEQLIEQLKNTLLPNIQPVGSLIFMALETPPPGYLYCDGSVRSRTEFKELFKAIGITWGQGDGSTTFNLPDLRGEFIRVWSKNSGSVDVNRRLGQAQGQTTAMPNSPFAAITAGGHGHTVSHNDRHNHSTDDVGIHHHNITGGSHKHDIQGNSPGFNRPVPSVTGIPPARTALRDHDVQTKHSDHHDHTVDDNGKHHHTVSFEKTHNHTLSLADNHPHAISGGDAETRPRNQALACYIKAFSNSSF